MIMKSELIWRRFTCTMTTTTKIQETVVGFYGEPQTSMSTITLNDTLPPESVDDIPAMTTNLAETQWVLSILLAPCTSCTLRRVGSSRGGIGNGVTRAFGSITNCACQAFGGVAKSVAYSANWNRSAGENTGRIEARPTCIARGVGDPTNGLPRCIRHAAKSTFWHRISMVHKSTRTV